MLSVINVEESDPKNNASSMGENLMTPERQGIESPFVNSLIASERQRVNGDMDNTKNEFQISMMSTNKRGTKEINQVGDDELDQIQSEARTLLLQDTKNHQHNTNRTANNSIQIHKNFVNVGEPKVQKHHNKIAYTEYPRAVNNTVKGPYRRNHQYNAIFTNTINPHVNKDSVEDLVSQNCPIPTRITLRDQTSKRHRGLPKKRYSQYKHKKYSNVASQKNGHPDEVFRTGSCWKTKMKFFQIYY